MQAQQRRTRIPPLFSGGIMNIKNLESFIYVAELGSFTKAAEKLGYSQSTVSFQIRQLEEYLRKIRCSFPCLTGSITRSS